MLVKTVARIVAEAAHHLSQILAQTVRHMAVDGPSACCSSSGAIDAAAETLDLQELTRIVVALQHPDTNHCPQRCRQEPYTVQPCLLAQALQAPS